MTHEDVSPMKKIITAVFLLGLFQVPAEGQHKDPLWMTQLKAQLVEQQSCDLNYTTNAFEREVGGTIMIEGRAHCRDGRAFDFSRNAPNSKFRIKNCEPVVC
jgi:hypothetical protein